MKDHDPYFTLARDVARRAGRLLLDAPCADRSVISDTCKDIKIEADRLLDDYIIRELSRNSDVQILTEESGMLPDSTGQSEYLWIVDPLDGSLNYHRGLPLSCVSIGLWKQMEPLLGVVYDFYRDELFSGIVGKGAWINDAEIHVSDIRDPSKAIICTGFPAATDYSRESLYAFVEKVRVYKKVRLLGSAALSLACVASGRADIYMENNIKWWDVGAGLALVKAAGGTISYERTKINHAFMVKASNPYLNTEEQG